jgi:hypothetical protein
MGPSDTMAERKYTDIDLRAHHELQGVLLRFAYYRRHMETRDIAEIRRFHPTYYHPEEHAYEAVLALEYRHGYIEKTIAPYGPCLVRYVPTQRGWDALELLRRRRSFRWEMLAYRDGRRATPPEPLPEHLPKPPEPPSNVVHVDFGARKRVGAK